MSIFKKIKKVLGKTAKKFGGPASISGALLGKEDKTASTPEAPVAAPVINTPVVSATEETASTPNADRKDKRGGKKALSVARSSGTGVNI